MSRQEHNMWSEESRGQQRGARGQQFKPEWIVTRTRREGEEKHHNVGLDSLARRSWVPEWSCETRWTEAASVRQNWTRVSEGMPTCGAWNEQTHREPKMRRQRKDCESGIPGIGDATMEEWNKKPASGPWLPTGPTNRKGRSTEESSSGETEVLAHREPEGPTGQRSSAHESIVNETITTPKTTTVELTPTK